MLLCKYHGIVKKKIVKKFIKKPPKRVGPTIRIGYLKGVWSPWKVTLVFERFYLWEGVSIFLPQLVPVNDNLE